MIKINCRVRHGQRGINQGGVYSFGVFLLELFLGERPTDEILKNDFNLHNFINIVLPGWACSSCGSH